MPNLYEDDARIEDGVSGIRLNSWRDLLPRMEKHRNSTCIYRGQADAQWKIESTLDRCERRFPTTPNLGGCNPPNFQCPPVSRETHLEAFKEAVRGKRGANPGDLENENEWWALAQHHGLATPLLDWTYSPFVALFFAFEEEGYVDYQQRKFCEPSERAVYEVPFHLIIDKGSEAHPAPEVFSPRREITHRLSSQSGVLMKMPKGVDLESSVRSRFPGESTSNPVAHARSILTKFIIPNKERKECLKLLNNMNINRMSLFGDLDGAARYINRLWELDFETPLGSLPDGTTTAH